MSQYNTRKGILEKEPSLSLLLDVKKEACCSDCCWQSFSSKAASLRMNQCCDWHLERDGRKCIPDDTVEPLQPAQTLYFVFCITPNFLLLKLV